jgi:1-acyl-sn-glycerol-3-phosphate acyltransferase
MIRSLIRLSVLLPATLIAVPIQYFAVKFNNRLAHRLPGMWHRLVCKTVDLRINVYGRPVDDRPLLITPNHTSWLDITVIGTLLPVSFIAKSEVASWPLFGTLARLQRTIFVDRTRRTDTAKVAAQIAGRLADGDAIVLFAEGTSGDGNYILPFRSALIGSAREAIDGGAKGRVWVQPMSVSYTRLQGIPMGRQFRSLAAWYGDMDLLPHLRAILREGIIDVDVIWGAPIAFDPKSDRKIVAAAAEKAVRAMSAAARRGRHDEIMPYTGSTVAGAVHGSVLQSG